MNQTIVTRDAVTKLRSGLPRTLNIAKISPDHKFGSYEEQLVTLAHAYEAEESLFLPLFDTVQERSDVGAFTSRGVQAVCLSVETFNFSTLKRLRELIAHHRIEVVNWNLTHPRNPYYFALRLTEPDLRHWYTDHISRQTNGVRSLRSRLATGLNRWLLSGYSRIICVSEFVKSQSASAGIWSNQRIAKHFINTDRFSCSEESRKATRQSFAVDDRFVMMTAAHLVREKGVDVAIRALATLPEMASLWIVGAGPDREKLELLAVELGVGDRVKFWGLSSEVQKYMQAADIFLCPSVWHEAAGLVNLEAQACGLPVVASRIGGIPEYISDGRTGLLFEAGNSDDLARKVLLLMHDEPMRARMAQAAAAWMEENFSIRTGLQPYLEAFRAG